MRALITCLACTTAVLAAAALADNHQHDNHPHDHHGGGAAVTPLTEPGSAAFAAIQEVVAKLLADPQTDWSRVDLEALRQHLIDMHNFTINVAVVEQKDIKGGVQFTVKPTTAASAGSLERLFGAHPAILKQETGWDMQVKKNNDGSFTAQVTSTKAEDAAKIRGLGYIGTVAFGQHHQLHHWQMATGTNPHHGH